MHGIEWALYNHTDASYPTRHPSAMQYGRSSRARAAGQRRWILPLASMAASTCMSSSAFWGTPWVQTRHGGPCSLERKQPSASLLSSSRPASTPPPDRPTPGWCFRHRPSARPRPRVPRTHLRHSRPYDRGPPFASAGARPIPHRTRGCTLGARRHCHFGRTSLLDGGRHVTRALTAGQGQTRVRTLACSWGLARGEGPSMSRAHDARCTIHHAKEHALLPRECRQRAPPGTGSHLGRPSSAAAVAAAAMWDACCPRVIPSSAPQLQQRLCVLAAAQRRAAAERRRRRPMRPHRLMRPQLTSAAVHPLCLQ